MAVALKKAIVTFMTNHVYQMGGSLKVHKEGGSIWAARTVQLSRVVMRWWDTEYEKRASQEVSTILMNSRYVDDILIAYLWKKSEVSLQ